MNKMRVHIIRLTNIISGMDSLKFFEGSLSILSCVSLLYCDLYFSEIIKRSKDEIKIRVKLIFKPWDKNVIRKPITMSIIIATISVILWGRFIEKNLLCF